ncbi:MAG: hypothetical protein ACI9JM_001091 [Halioglobus sp.]|jgi:hypothetical protein
MNIHAVDAGVRPNINVSRGPNAASVKEAATPQETAPKIADDSAGEAEKVKGVVSLLQAGHFQGVADARLRINFHDEISQIGASLTAQQTSEATSGFSVGVTEDVAALAVSIDVSEEQAAPATDVFDNFTAMIDALAVEFADKDGADFQELTAGFQSAADDFILQLQDLLGLDAADPDIESFISAFAARLGSLDGALATAVDALPELSQPNGNGAAYAKFVEILEGLGAAEDNSGAAGDLVETFA